MGQRRIIILPTSAGIKVFCGMQYSKKLSLLSHPCQQELLDQWTQQSNQLIDHYQSVNDCCNKLSRLQSGIVFIGWHTEAPAESAKNLALVNANTMHDVYIVIIADNNPERDVVHSLNLGADRYICTDTSPAIFAAYMESLERRITPVNHILHYPPYRLDNKNRAVHFGPNKIVLTQSEFRIAHYLFENQNRPLTRESLLRDVWGLPDLKHNRRVDTKMSHIRRKMQLDGTYGWKLRFPRGKGYHLQSNFGNGNPSS